jgi:hypothetical protein
VDTNRVVRKPTPKAWREEVKGVEVAVIPLVKDPEKNFQNGWISYYQPLIDSPEVEIICGGLNEKDLRGGALWRQGHLLHFAFDLSPSDMNEVGQALLLNSIAYIARFTEDRPIARTRTAWDADGAAPRSRRWIEDLFVSRKPSEETLNYYLNPATISLVRNMNRPTYEKWFKENSTFISCDSKGRLAVDTTAKGMGIVFDAPDFVPKCLTNLTSAVNTPKARVLLDRYVPDGPRTNSFVAWNEWWEENRPYLFFSERGGYRWYIDPLAKRRGIPSRELRGPARATLK